MATIFSGAPEIGTAFNLVASLIVLIVAMSFNIKQGSAISQRMTRRARMVLIYIVWSGVSIIWTGAASKMVSLLYWGASVIDVLVVLFLFKDANAEKILAQSLKGIVFGASILAVSSVFLFGVGEDGRLHDRIIHVNAIGFQLSIAALSCTYFILKDRLEGRTNISWCLGFFGLFFALVLTLSKTSILSFAISLIGLILLARGGRLVAIGLLLFLTLFLSVMWPFIEVYISSYVESQANGLSSFETLSGRTLLWSATLEMISESPWLGYGLMSFRDIGPFVFNIRVVHAHNEFLHQFFSLGIIGVALFVGVYYSALREFSKGRFAGPSISSASLLGISLVVMAISRGITEAAVLGTMLPLPMLVLVLCSSQARV